MRIVHDHARSLGAALPDPVELALPVPSSAAPEALRLTPLSGETPRRALDAPAPRLAAPPAAPLVAALHRRLRDEVAAAPSDELRAALAMTSLLTELDALAARVRAEQRAWLRA